MSTILLFNETREIEIIKLYKTLTVSSIQKTEQRNEKARNSHRIHYLSVGMER